MILEEIKRANVQAMKDKNVNARTIYSIIMNKAMLETIKKREKNEELADADLVQIIQKTIKELTEESENYAKVGNTTEQENVLAQKKILETYLPQMLTEAEIEKIISSLADKSVGSVMKHFKAEYAGKCDMRTVQEVMKRFQ